MRDRVPAEFVGKARVFRDRMIAATTGVGMQMNAISQYSFGLYKRRNAAPRPEHLIAIEQQWRSISPGGCLRLTVRRDRRSMSIADTRITATTSKNIEWGDASEKSICLIESSLALTKRHAETMTTTLAAVSLHALGRWYQRAFTTNDTAMMLDLALVVKTVPTLDPGATDVELPSGNGGSSRGAIVENVERKECLQHQNVRLGSGEPSF
jgi:hypothetical protein